MFVNIPASILQVRALRVLVCPSGAAVQIQEALAGKYPVDLFAFCRHHNAHIRILAPTRRKEQSWRHAEFGIYFPDHFQARFRSAGCIVAAHHIRRRYRRRVNAGAGHLQGLRRFPCSVCHQGNDQVSFIIKGQRIVCPFRQRALVCGDTHRAL